MPADILIVGQGLAGSLLAWEFERAGFSFAVADSGDGPSASRVAAGMINPVTGRRFVKAPDFEPLMAAARESYQQIETALGLTLWRDLRVRRLFRTPAERVAFEAKLARGEFGASVRASDADGFWIEGAARVDTAALLAGLRARLAAAGRLRPERVALACEAPRHVLVIDCSGAALAQPEHFPQLPWALSKGEILSVATEGLDPAVILNQGHWVLPTGPGLASVGATHEPHFAEPGPTPAARQQLEAAAARILQRPFQTLDHAAAVRIGLPDRRPVAGRHPTDARLGVMGGLGNKGVLTAPTLARHWMNHLSEGVPFARAWGMDRRAD